MNEKELTKYRIQVKIKLIKMGASMKDLADAIGVSRQHLNNFLNQPGTYKNVKEKIDAGIKKLQEER